jgi:hypothetical protein
LAAGLLVLALLGGGAAALLRPAPSAGARTASPAEQPARPSPPPAPAGLALARPSIAAPRRAALRAAEGGRRARVSGRVCDAAGRPLPRAHVAALAPQFWGPRRFAAWSLVLRRARAGPGGAFELEVPADYPTWYPENRQITLVAWADGHAPRTLGPLPLEPEAAVGELRLPAARDLRVRLEGPDGAPVAGARAHLVQLGGAAHNPDVEADGLPFWGHPARSDANGLVVFRGLSREQAAGSRSCGWKFATTASCVEPWSSVSGPRRKGTARS